MTVEGVTRYGDIGGCRFPVIGLYTKFENFALSLYFDINIEEID